MTRNNSHQKCERTCNAHHANVLQVIFRADNSNKLLPTHKGISRSSQKSFTKYLQSSPNGVPWSK